MKVATEQKNAKSWANALVKLNAATPGQIQITYQDENGNKAVGYTDLFDISIVVDKQTYSFGEWLKILATIVDRHGSRLAAKDTEILALQAKNQELEKAIAEIKSKFPDVVWGL